MKTQSNKKIIMKIKTEKIENKKLNKKISNSVYLYDDDEKRVCRIIVVLQYDH